MAARVSGCAVALAVLLLVSAAQSANAGEPRPQVTRTTTAMNAQESGESIETLNGRKVTMNARETASGTRGVVMQETAVNVRASIESIVTMNAPGTIESVRTSDAPGTMGGQASVEFVGKMNGRERTMNGPGPVMATKNAQEQEHGRQSAMRAEGDETQPQAATNGREATQRRAPLNERHATMNQDAGPTIEDDVASATGTDGAAAAAVDRPDLAATDGDAPGRTQAAAVRSPTRMTAAETAGPCCQCCLEDNCPVGYSCCGIDDTTCYCCVQGRTCEINDDNVGLSTCTRTRS